MLFCQVYQCRHAEATVKMDMEIGLGKFSCMKSFE